MMKECKRKEMEGTEGTEGVLVPPLGYQADYVRDGSRFKIWVASRQVGKS